MDTILRTNACADRGESEQPKAWAKLSSTPLARRARKATGLAPPLVALGHSPKLLPAPLPLQKQGFQSAAQTPPAPSLSEGTAQTPPRLEKEATRTRNRGALKANPTKLPGHAARLQTLRPSVELRGWHRDIPEVPLLRGSAGQLCPNCSPYSPRVTLSTGTEEGARVSGCEGRKGLAAGRNRRGWRRLGAVVGQAALRLLPGEEKE